MKLKQIQFIEDGNNLYLTEVIINKIKIGEIIRETDDNENTIGYDVCSYLPSKHPNHVTCDNEEEAKTWFNLALNYFILSVTD